MKLEAILTNADLDDFGLRNFFDGIVLSSNVLVSKPDPEIIQLALKPLGVAPSTAVFVGDTWSTDIRGALAAGMSALHLTQKASERPGMALRGRVVEVAPSFAGIMQGLKSLDALLAGA